MQQTPPGTPPQRDERIVQEFQDRKKKQYLITGLVLLPLIFVVFDVRGTLPELLLGITVGIVRIVAWIVFIVGIIFSFTNWRCPACNGYLRKNMHPAFCPKCGTPLV